MLRLRHSATSGSIGDVACKIYFGWLASPHVHFSKYLKNYKHMSTSFLLKFNNYVKPSICDFFIADSDFNKAQDGLDFLTRVLTNEIVEKYLQKHPENLIKSPIDVCSTDFRRVLQLSRRLCLYIRSTYYLSSSGS